MGAIATDVLETVLRLSKVSEYRAGMRHAGAAHTEFLKSLEKADRWQAWGTAGVSASTAVAAALFKTAQIAGNMEQIKIGLSANLGGVDAAEKRIKELQDLADKSPFNFEEIARGEQMLLGFGVQATKTTGILTGLGNALSNTGRLDRLPNALLAIGQIQSTGKLEGDELRQLVEAGVPVDDILKKMGTSLGNVGKAGIKADRFIGELIKTLNSGKFAGAMEQQSKTMVGSFSYLGDAAQRLGTTIGDGLVGPLGAGARGLGDLAKSVNDLVTPIKGSLAPVVGGVALVLGGLGIKALYTAAVTRKLAGENIHLTNQLLKAATGETTLAGDLNATSGATARLTGLTLELAAAHMQAARAAQAHALAERGIGGGGGGVPFSGQGGAGGPGGAGGTALKRRPAGPPPGYVSPGKGAAVFDPDKTLHGARVPGLSGGSTATVAAAALAGKAGGTAAKSAGLLGKAGAVAGKFKGAGLSTAAMFVGEQALNLAPDEGNIGKGKRVAQGALNGAGVGSLAGTIIGGIVGAFAGGVGAIPGAAIGNRAGAALGGLIGGGVAVKGEMDADAAAKKALLPPPTADPMAAMRESAFGNPYAGLSDDARKGSAIGFTPSELIQRQTGVDPSLPGASNDETVRLLAELVRLQTQSNRLMESAAKNGVFANELGLPRSIGAIAESMGRGSR